MKNSWRIFRGLHPQDNNNNNNNNNNNAIEFGTTKTTGSTTTTIVQEDDSNRQDKVQTTAAGLFFWAKKQRCGSSSAIETTRGHHEHDDDVVVACKKTKSIVASLTDDELEVAARTYYEYSIDNTNNNNNQLTTTAVAVPGSSAAVTTTRISKNQNETRYKYATALARQYVKWYRDESIETIVHNLKDNIRFRIENEIDQLRVSHTNNTSTDYIPIRRYVGQKNVYVCGYDIDGRSTYYFIPRNVQCHDSVYTRRVHLWTMERAIACSKHTDRMINAIVDFNGFNINTHSPPLAIGKDLLRTLSYHYYTNHIHNVFLVDAPAPFLYMWSMVFKHFINKRTASKIHFINNRRPIPNSSSQQQQQQHNDDGVPMSTPLLYHSFQSNTRTAIQHQEKNKFRRSFFSFLPFLSSSCSDTAVTTTSSSSSSSTRLLRAGGTSTMSLTPSTSTKSTRLFAIIRQKHDDDDDVLVPQQQQQQQRRRQKRDKVTTSCTEITNKSTRRNELDYKDNSGSDESSSTTSSTGTDSSNIQSDSILHQLYSSDQVPSWIIQTGTKNRELNVEEYLDVLPFNHAFDE